MRRIESGDVTLGPTDKDYKVYVMNRSGDSFRATHRTDSRPFQGWDSPEHDWVTREVTQAKFYFPHLSSEQKQRFVELLNEKRIHFEEPGYFYRMPFFIETVKRSNAEPDRSR